MDGELQDSTTIKEWLEKILKPYWHADGTGKRSDPEYYLPSRDEFLGFMQYLEDNPIADIGDDCNYYCEKLRVMALEYGRKTLKLGQKMCVGFAWGNFNWMRGGNEHHCCNFVVQAGWQFNWIEPQHGSLHLLDQCVEGSLAFILF